MSGSYSTNISLNTCNELSVFFSNANVFDNLLVNCLYCSASNSRINPHLTLTDPLVFKEVSQILLVVEPVLVVSALLLLTLPTVVGRLLVALVPVLVGVVLFLVVIRLRAVHVGHVLLLPVHVLAVQSQELLHVHHEHAREVSEQLAVDLGHTHEVGVEDDLVQQHLTLRRLHQAPVLALLQLVHHLLEHRRLVIRINVRPETLDLLTEVRVVHHYLQVYSQTSLHSHVLLPFS